MTNPDCTIPTKRCPKCGETKPTSEFHRNKSRRDGLHSYCKACFSASARRSREKNRDKNLETSRRWQQANPDKVSECQRRYRQSHRDERIAQSRAYREENPDKVLAYRRRYYEANADEIRKRARAYRDADPNKANERLSHWRKANPDKSREYCSGRRARKRNAEGAYSVVDIRAQLKRQKGRCYWCNEKVTEYHVDHVIPLSRGGSNGPENLVIACPFCNLSKKDKLPHEWNGNGGRMF